ncbi:MAG: hypothetical protein ABSB74_14060 [Tepidisphaeraceae bacterium]
MDDGCAALVPPPDVALDRVVGATGAAANDMTDVVEMIEKVNSTIWIDR